MKRILLAVATLALFALPAQADTWAQQHPRRAQVVHRANHQERAVGRALYHGKISPREARQLYREDQAIKRQERAYARRHHGHITPAEQRRLNREENRVHRQFKYYRNH